MTILTAKGRVCPPAYRELRIASVPRRVCDRRVPRPGHHRLTGPAWGTRIVHVTVPRISLIDGARDG